MVELLVVLGIISLLVAILLPAIMQSRSSARRLACLNHLRQVSLAMMLQADLHDRFPAAGLFGATRSTQHHNWVTSILPQLDQASLFNQYDRSRAYTQTENFELTRTPLPVLVCPDDVSVQPGEGNLSFVVNGGIGWTIPVDCPANLRTTEDQVTIVPMDLNGNGVVCPLEKESETGPSDTEMLESLSLFFVENWPPKSGTQRFHRPRDVVDGLSQTILLAENVRAGYDPHASSSWGSPEPLRAMFFVSSEVCKKSKCTPEQIDLSRANSRVDTDAARQSLNSALSQAEGTAPWPTSGHAGLVHVAWCDGRVTALSEFIDGKTYFAMITPRGVHGSGPFEEPVITSNF